MNRTYKEIVVFCSFSRHFTLFNKLWFDKNSCCFSTWSFSTWILKLFFSACNLLITSFRLISNKFAWLEKSVKIEVLAFLPVQKYECMYFNGLLVII